MIVCDIKELARIHQNTNTYKTHTHTHTLVFMVYGDSMCNDFYTVQTVCAIALHLNLALTGDCVSTFPTEKLTLYDL